MAQLTIDTQDYKDLYETMQTIYHILLYNKNDIEFCPIEDFKKLEEKYNALKINYNTCLEELNSTNKRLNEEIEKNKTWEPLQTDYLQEIEKLKVKLLELEDRNSKLEEELGKYNINISDPAKEIILLGVEDYSLKLTTIENKAFYFAAKKGSAYEFCYNESKAQHLKAIESYKTILEPFCEIEGVILPDAKRVESRGIGLLTIDENDCFVVEEKAKVRLVKD